MPTSQSSEAILHIRRTVLLRDAAGLTDGQLLEDYVRCREEAALGALVGRHGSMVWGVCRRVLCNWHDAEDAFQATFLVLIRKAASIAAPELLASWLYGVAHQTALKARAKAAKRQARERQVKAIPDTAAAEQNVWRDLQPVLDQALSRLPDVYRVAIVLCDLEGKTRREAARQLGVPDGTLAARLTRARVLLAKRLARHGLVMSGGSSAAMLLQNTAPACVPLAVASGTIKALSRVAARQTATAGIISSKVAALSEGVLRTMFLTKVRIAAAVLMAVGVLVSGTGWLTHQALAQKPGDPPAKDAVKGERTEVSGVVKAVDVARNTILLHAGKGTPVEETFTLDADAKVLLDDGTGDRLGFQEGKLADVTEGTSVTLRLSAGQKVTRVWVEGPTIQGTLKAADAANRSITAAIAVSKSEPVADKTFPVHKRAKLIIDDGQAPDKSKPAKEPSLADLPANAVVFLKLSADRRVVGGIRAEGQTVTGLLKSVDAAKNTVSATISVKGEPDVDRTFPVATSATVSVDDGKPQDKAKLAELKRLDDLPVGAQVTLRLSLDGGSVVAIRAEGSNVHGTVKSVDAAKSILTLDNKVGEKTFRVLQDASVYLDDKSDIKKLADVPGGAVVNLKLLPDQQTVREIRAHGPTVMGSVAGNAGNDSITVRDKEGEKTFAVARDARIAIEEKNAGKLSDLIDGTVVQLRLSVDLAAVLEVHAEGPSFQGKVKSFDPDKGTITLTIGSKGGQGGEDKDFKMTKETVVLSEMSTIPLKLTDLRTDKEVVLRLSIDQKAANRIMILGE